MPSSRNLCINFLETQWSSITPNKIKGIEAEIRLEQHLNSVPLNQLYEFLIPGGWIISPGKNQIIDPPTAGRIAIIPIPTSLSWTGYIAPTPFSAQVLAHAYLRQVGIKTYFAKFDTLGNAITEASFIIPARRNYQTNYNLEFFEIGANGLVQVPIATLISNFTPRIGMRGMRAYALGRINNADPFWQRNDVVTQLFWKEYSRYFIHRNYLVSSNDLDFFLVGKSGRAYPVEFKSKQVFVDNTIGDWFGLDVGPFTKLSFFISLSNNMEAIYIVEEIDAQGNTIQWWATKFTHLLKYCHWVSQGGGRGMGGGASVTVKVPKIIFEPLNTFLPQL